MGSKQAFNSACCDWSFSDGEKERAMRSERPRLG